MEIWSYRTIKAESRGIYKEKGSRFLAFAYPVDTEDDIRVHLDSLRKQYFDARHHCYAYVLGPDRTIFRANDDGEPNHSAGDPILGQIRSRELTNIVVVVVRYFGGTKLGVSGLINAYKQAASYALEHATIVEKEITQEVAIVYEYSSSAEVMRLIKDFNLTVEEQAFEADCFLRANYRVRDSDRLHARIKLLMSLGQIKTFSI